MGSRIAPIFKDKNSFTALHVDALNNQFEVFYELVQLKADYNDKTFIDLNPYQIAQKVNSHSIIEYLDGNREGKYAKKDEVIRLKERGKRSRY
ncbi:MAG: ankyrin repeat domain-containing protein [Candidatus Midichloria sp.]|nr:ankyrin repeat domain-containing protein [Candidatus Midichloria sp.]